MTILVGLPFVAGAQPLAPGCEGADCEFSDLVAFGQNIIGWLLRIAIPIATILFAYAGFLYLTSAEKPGQRDTAKKIFGSVFVGLVIALAAWIIVSFITNLLIKPTELNPNPDDVFEPRP